MLSPQVEAMVGSFRSCQDLMQPQTSSNLGRSHPYPLSTSVHPSATIFSGPQNEYITQCIAAATASADSADTWVSSMYPSTFTHGSVAADTTANTSSVYPSTLAYVSVPTHSSTSAYPSPSIAPIRWGELQCGLAFDDNIHVSRFLLHIFYLPTSSLNRNGRILNVRSGLPDRVASVLLIKIALAVPSHWHPIRVVATRRPTAFQKKLHPNSATI